MPARRRLPLPALGLVLALTAGCTSALAASSSPTPQASAMSEADAEIAREVCAQNSPEALVRTYRGVQLGRSGDIQLIPRFPDFMGAGLPHATPYDYTQQVPLFLYGAGVKPGVYTRSVDLTDIAPTEGALLNFRFEALDGTAQRQALQPSANRQPPRLVVTLVWDSGGMDVLNAWPDDWPFLRSLLPHGAWFTHATVGASPSNTPTGHAEIGTGAYPMHNGFTDDYITLNGQIQKPNANGPAFLEVPTLADLYDRAMGNEPIVGAAVTLSAHVMMMSHGSLWGGGDKDIAITREVTNAPTAGAEATSWNLAPQMAPFYQMPAYVNDLPGLSTYLPALDRMDGAADGKWRSHPMDQLLGGFYTPARTPYQTKMIETLIQHEGFGADEVPDLLSLNYKAIDVVGHLFSVNSPEMSDTVKIQDDALRQLVTFLNRTVGKGRWTMALTADHGTQLDPAASGAFVANIDAFTAAIEQRFDTDGDETPLLVRVRPTQIWVDPEEMTRNDVSLDEISRYVITLTQAQTIRSGLQPNAASANDRVFSAAVPSTLMGSLPCLPG